MTRFERVRVSGELGQLQLQAQCLSFGLDKLTFMSKVPRTIPAHVIRELLLKATVKPLRELFSTNGHLFSA